MECVADRITAERRIIVIAIIFLIGKGNGYKLVGPLELTGNAKPRTMFNAAC